MPPVSGLVWFEDGDTHLATYGDGVAGVPVDRSGSGYVATGTERASVAPQGTALIPNNGHAVLHPPFIPGTQSGYVGENLGINYPTGADYTEIWVIPGGVYNSLSFLQISTYAAAVIDGVALNPDAASIYAAVAASGYWLSVGTVGGESMSDPYLVVGVNVGWSTAIGSVRINSVITPAIIWADTWVATLGFYSYNRPAYAHLVYNRVLTQAEHEEIQAWVATWSAPLTPATPVAVARGPAGVTMSWSTGASMVGASRYSEDAAGVKSFHIASPAGTPVSSPFVDPGAVDATAAYAYNLRFDDQTNAVVPVPVDTRTAMNVTADLAYSTGTITWDGPAGSYELKRDGVVVNPLATSPYIETALTEKTSYIWNVGSATHSGSVAASTPPRPPSLTYVSSEGQWMLIPSASIVDHAELIGRDAANAHTQNSITGLTAALLAKSNVTHSHAFASVFVQPGTPAGAKSGDMWVT
jgi:hypothetical protein